MDKLSLQLKLYSVFILIAGFVQMFRKMLTDTGGPPSRYGAVVVAVVIVFVLIAKANEQAIGKAWMWKSLFLALMLATLVMLAFGLYLGTSGVYVSAVLLAGGALVLAPALSEIFIYAYRSPQLWRWNDEDDYSEDYKE